MAFDFISSYLIRFQHILFYVIMSLARFNLYGNSYSFLYKHMRDGKRERGGKWVWWAEVTGICVFWVWFSLVLKGCGDWRTRVAYVLVSHIVPSPLHVQVCAFDLQRYKPDKHLFRSCCPTFLCQPKTWVRLNPSLIDNFGRLRMLCVHRISSFYTVVCTFRSRIIYSLAFLDTT